MAKTKKTVKVRTNRATVQKGSVEELHCDKKTIMVAIPQNSSHNSITVNGDGNTINVINGPMEDDCIESTVKIDAPVEKQQTSAKSFFLGILQSVVTKIILWILGGVGAVILGYFALG